MNELLKGLKDAVLSGDAERAAALAEQCLAAAMPATTIFDEAIIAGIHEAGILWDCNRYAVPDMILSADAFNAAVAVVERRMPPHYDDSLPKVLVGVVEGDVHDLGKSILVIMLRAAGLHVVDLGVDLPVRAFVDAVRRERPAVLGIGAYMSTTMLSIPEIVQALQAAGLRSGVHVLVGGVPTSQPFADAAGADAWARDASSAVERVNALLGRPG